MKTRILAALLVMTMVLGCISVSAATRNYSPGSYEYIQDLSKAVSATNAVVGVGKLEIQGGGSATYDFTLPFDAAKMTITYEASRETELKVITERQEYTATLAKNETSAVINLLPERMGAFSVTISASNTVNIKNILYTKVESREAIDTRWTTELVYPTEYEDALQSSVVIPANSNTIKVKNAVRRIDMSDPNVTVKYINDKMYMPLSSFAHAMGLYYEDYPDLEYAYMSGETYVWYYKNGENWCQYTSQTKTPEDKPVYDGSILYIPVRETAESMGKTVGYRDGYAIVGMRTEVSKILDDSIFSQLTKEMKQYIIDGENEKGNEYHVSASSRGNDSNPGTEELPFATVQKAANVARPGDTVIIHDGTYRESVTFPTDGTGTKPIIFKAADGEEPVISAFEEVSGFAPYTNEVNGVEMYVKDLSALEFETTEPDTWTNDRNFIIYNDKTLLEGRHPNSNTSVTREANRYNYKTIDPETNPDGRENFTFVKVPDYNPFYPDLETNEVLPTRGDMRFQDIIRKGSLGNPGTYQHVLYSDIDLNQTTPNYWQGATCMAFIGMAWSLVPSKVVSSEYGKATIEEYWSGGFGPTYYESKYASDYAWLTHHLNTVDMPGEWYIDNEAKLLYIIPPKGVNIEDFKPEVKARQQVLDLTDRKYIQIENINTRGGGMTMNNAKGCILNGGKHKYISQADGSMSRDVKKACIYHANQTLSGFSYQDDAPEYGEMGFYLGGDSNAIVNADIEYSAGAGIYLTGKYQYVYNNKVDKTGWGGSYATGIFVTRKGTEDDGVVKGGHQIYSNTTYASYRAGIEVDYGFKKDGEQGDMTVHTANDMAYNEIAWANVAARDTGVFYQWGTVGGDDQERSEFHHNMIHDAVGSRMDSIMSANFYTDGGTSGYDIYDNICYSTSSDWYYRAKQYFFWDGFIRQDMGFAWSNWSDEIGHEDGFKATTIEYPNGIASKFGATQNVADRFMENYNKVTLNDIVMLGDAEHTGNVHMDKDGYTISPDFDSTINGKLTLGDKGTVVAVYYSEDKYNKTLQNSPTVKLQLFKDGNCIYNNERQALGFGRYMDSGAELNFYINGDITGEVEFKLSSNVETMRLRKISATPFDYNAENAKRVFPYDSIAIAIGSADEVIPAGPSGTAQYQDDLTSDAYDEYRHAYYKGTWENDFVFKDRKFDREVNKLVFIAGSNYTYSNSKAVIIATNKETGETGEIGYVDGSSAYRKGDSWHTEQIEGVLYAPIKPGVYDIKVDFQKAEETSGRAAGCFDAYSLVFFADGTADSSDTEVNDFTKKTIDLGDKSSSAEGIINLSDVGTELTLFYQDDDYEKTVKNSPKINLTLTQDGKIVYSSEKQAFGFKSYTEDAAKLSFYVSNKLTGDATFKLTCDKSSLKMKRFETSRYNYISENTNRAFPVDANAVLFGSADEVVDEGISGKAEYMENLSNSTAENFTYSYYKGTWENNFLFNNRTFVNEVNNVVLVGATNYTYSNTKAKITITDKATGESKEIGYIDCSGLYQNGDHWMTKNMMGSLTEPIKPGTYDIKVDFQKAEDKSGRAAGCLDAFGLMFF